MARNPKPLRQAERRLMLKSPYGFRAWGVVDILVHRSWMSWTDRIQFDHSLLKGEDRWKVVVDAMKKCSFLQPNDLPPADDGFVIEMDGARVRAIVYP